MFNCSRDLHFDFFVHISFKFLAIEIDHCGSYGNQENDEKDVE